MVSKPESSFAYYYDPFVDGVSPDTAPRRLIMDTLKTAPGPLSSPALARIAQVTDQAARNFLHLIEKNYLTVHPGRPKRYLWRTNLGDPKAAHGSPNDSASPRGKIILSWNETGPAGKSRGVKVTLEGIPQNGSFRISGIPAQAK
jgi:hypothetical protein